MRFNRRQFIMSMISSGIISIFPHSLPAKPETVEDRIKRLFSKCAFNKTSHRCTELLPVISGVMLIEEISNNKLLMLSDKDFMRTIEENISQDFSKDNIVNVAGWQLSHTETKILQIINS